MRQFMLFLLGILLGFVLAMFYMQHKDGSSKVEPAATETIIDSSNPANIPGVTLFETPKAFEATQSFEVHSVEDYGAIARCGETYRTFTSYDGAEVYLYEPGENQFYDGQVVKIPQGKKAIQLGVYKYKYLSEYKTLPFVQIVDE